MTHEIRGTNFNCNQDVKNEPLKHYLARQLSPDINFIFEEIFMEGKKLVLLTIPVAKLVPTSYAGESIPVNKKLSEIFLQLNISEKTGRGVPKITERYGRDVYEFRENSIVVKIPFRWINVMGDKVGDNEADFQLNRRNKNAL